MSLGCDSPAQSAVGGTIGGDLTCVSMKFNRTPLLHVLLDFLQFWQTGSPSSHFKCLSRQVRQPVLTLLGLLGAAAESAATLGEDSSSFVIGGLLVVVRFFAPALMVGFRELEMSFEEVEIMSPVSRFLGL